MPFKTANTDWNCLSFHFSHLSAILAKLTVTWYKRVDWTPFIFLVCCPFVPPFSSVCCAIQQPLYCIFTLTTNLRRPLWVNRWFQPYLVLRNEQLESKQSQVKTYPSYKYPIQNKPTSDPKQKNTLRSYPPELTIICVCVFFVKHLRSVYETIPPHTHKTIQKHVFIPYETEHMEMHSNVFWDSKIIFQV